MGKPPSEKIIERITELQLENNRLEKQYGVKLPLSSYIDQIEKGIDTKDVKKLQKQLSFLEKKISTYEEILSIDLSEMDVEDIIGHSSSLKEIEEQLTSKLERIVQSYKEKIQYLEKLNKRDDSLKGLKNKLEQLSAESDKKNLKASFRTLKGIEKGIGKAFEEKKYLFEDMIRDYRERIKKLEKGNAKKEEIKELKKHLKRIRSLLESDRFMEFQDESEDIEKNIEKLSLEHSRFTEEFEKVKKHLEDIRLPEDIENGYMETLDDILRVKDGYDRGREKLEILKKEIRKEEQNAEEIVEEIDELTDEDSFLNELIEKVDLRQMMEKKIENKDFVFLLEEGKNHLRNLKDLKADYGVLNNRLNEVRRSFEEIHTSLQDVQEYSSRLKSLEKDIGRDDFLEKEDFELENYHQKLKSIFQDYEEHIDTLEEEIEKELESQKREAKNRLEVAEGKLNSLKQEKELGLESEKKKIELARNNIDEKNYADAIEITESVIQSLEKKSKEMENRELIIFIYQILEPLLGKAKKDSIIRDIRKIEEIIRRNRFDDEKADYAKRVKKRVDQYLEAKLEEINDEIKNLQNSETDLEMLPEIVDEAKESYESERYAEVLDKCAEADRILERKKRERKKLEKKCNEFIDELEKCTKETSSIDVEEMISELEEVKEINKPEDGLKKIEKIERSLNQEFLDLRKELIESNRLITKTVREFENKAILMEEIQSILRSTKKSLQATKNIRGKKDRKEILKSEADLQEASELLEETRKRFSEFEDLIEKIGEKKEEADRWGIDIEDLNQRLISIKTGSDYLEEKIKSLNSLESEICSRINELKEGITNLIQNYRENISVLKEKGAKEEYVERIEEKLEKVENPSKLDRDTTIINLADEIAESVEELSRKHQRFEERLNQVKDVLEKTELPVREQKVIQQRIKEAEKISRPYEEEIEEIESISQDIDHIEKRAEEMLTKIRTKISEESLLMELDQKYDLVKMLKDKINQRSFSYILEKGEAILKSLNTISDHWISIKENYMKVLELEEEVNPNPTSLEDFNTVLDSFGIDLVQDGFDIERILENESIDEISQDLFELQKRFECLDDEVTSVKENVEAAVENEKKKVIDELESIEAYIQKMEKKYPLDIDSYLREIKEAKRIIENDDLERASDSCEELRESIEQDVNLIQNERDIRDIYETLSPLVDKIDNKYLLNKIHSLAEMVEEKKFRNNDLTTAENIEEDIEDWFLEKIDFLNERIEGESEKGISLEACRQAVEHADDELEGSNYVKALEYYREGEELLEERKEDYVEYNKLYEDIEQDLKRLDETPIDAEPLLDELKTMEEEYSKEGIKKLESLKIKITETVKEYRMDSLERIDQLRKKMLEFEEKGVKFEECWSLLETANDEINDINYRNAVQKSDNIFIADNKIREAEEQIENKLIKYEDLQGKKESLEEKLERADEIGLKTDDLRETLEEIGNEPLKLKDIEKDLETIESLNDEISSRFNDFKEKIKERLEEERERVIEYREKKCYFPEFSEDRKKILAALESENYGKALSIFEELKARIKEKIKSFENAKEKERLVSKIFDDFYALNIDLEDHEKDFSTLFSYDDYERAKRDYQDLLDNIAEDVEEYKENLKDKLLRLDEKSGELSEESDFELDRVNEKIKEGMEQFFSEGEQKSDLSNELLQKCELCKRIQSLVDEAKELLNKFEEKHESFKENIGKLEDKVQDLEKAEIEFNELLKDIDSLTKKDDLGVALEESELILDKAEDLISEYQDRSRDEIREAKDLLSSLSERGIEIGKSQKILNAAISYEKKGFYKKAIRKAQESKNTANTLKNKHQEAERIIKSLESRIEEDLKKDLYLVNLALEFERVKDISDYSKKIEKLEEISRDIEDREKEKKAKMKEKIESFYQYLKELKEKGVNINRVEQKLERAEKELETVDFREARKSTLEAYEVAKKLKKSHEKAQNLLEKTIDQIEDFREMGIETEGLKDDLLKKEKEGEYEALIKECKNIKETLNERKSKKESTLKDKIEDLGKRLVSLSSKGLNTDPIKEELIRCETILENNDYSACLEILNKTEEKIENRKSHFEKFRSLVEDVERRLNTAKIAELEVDIETKKERFRELNESNDYQDAVSELQLMKNELDGRIEQKRAAVSSKVERLEKRSKELISRGEKIGMDFHLQEIEEIKTLFNNRKLSKAEEKADQLVTKLEEKENACSQLEVYFELADKLVDFRSGKGMNTNKLREKIMKAKTTNTSYADIREKKSSLEELLSKYGDETRELIRNRYEELYNNVQEERKEDGLKSEVLEFELREEIDSLEDVSLFESIEYLAVIISKKEDLEKAHKKYVMQREQAEDLKDRLESYSIDVYETEKDIEKARSLRDYESAFELLEKSMKRMRDDLQEHVEKKRDLLTQNQNLLEEIKESTHMDLSFDEISRIEEKISEAETTFESEDLEEFFALIDDIENEVSPFRKKYKESLMESFQELDQKLDYLQEEDIEVEELYSKFQELQSRLTEGNIYGVGPELRELSKKIDEKHRRVERRNELFDEVKKKYQKSISIGLPPNSLDEIPAEGLEGIKRMDDLEEAVVSLEKIREELKNTEEKWIKSKEEKYEKLNARVESIPEKYVDPSVERHLEHVEEILNNGRYEEAQEELEKVESDIENCEETWQDIKERIELPFTHGIESELQILTQDGSWIEGEKMKEIFEHILEDAKYFVYKKIKRGDIPDYVFDKIHGIKIQQDKAGNEAVHVKYEVNGKRDWFSIIGKDSHVTTTTNILEIQTPPCGYLKELEWWLKTVFEESYRAVKKLGTGLLLVSTAMNPIEGFSQGVTFGDHHHVGIPDDDERRAAYNMLRNYIPHIIALSVNSPIPGGDIPEIKKNQDNSLISPLTSLSLRIENNIGQLSCPPVLEESHKEEDYLDKVSRNEESARMVDIYPFTRFDTIELRICDTQLTLSDRLGLAVLIQAIALKAKKMKEEGEFPDTLSERVLLNMRENAYKNGLLSPFLTASYDLDGPLERYYPELTENHQGHKNSDLKFIKDGCIRLLYWLKKELIEIDVLGSQYIDPLLIKLFGPKSSHEVGAPLTSAQYQLYLLRENNHDLERFLFSLDEISSKCGVHPDYNPIIDDFGYPEVPTELQPETMNLRVKSNEVSYIGDEKMRIDTTLFLRNQSSNSLSDISINCKYLSKDGSELGRKNLDIPVFKKDEKESIRFEKIFGKKEDAFATEIVIEVLEEGEIEVRKQLPLPPQTKVSIDVSYTGPKLMHAGEREVDIPYSIEIKNLHEEVIEGEVNICIKDEQGEKRDEREVQVEIKERDTFASVLPVTSDWALNALKNQDYEEIEPLQVELEDNREEFFIEAKLDIEDRSSVSQRSDNFEVMSSS